MLRTRKCRPTPNAQRPTANRPTDHKVTPIYPPKLRFWGYNYKLISSILLELWSGQGFWTKGDNSKTEPPRVMVLVTALPLNELYNCVKFEVDTINSSRDMLRTKFVTVFQQREIIQKWNHPELWFLSLHFLSMSSITVWSLKLIPSIVQEICSGQNLWRFFNKGR